MFLIIKIKPKAPKQQKNLENLQYFFEKDIKCEELPLKHFEGFFGYWRVSGQSRKNVRDAYTHQLFIKNYVIFVLAQLDLTTRY